MEGHKVLLSFFVFIGATCSTYIDIGYNNSTVRNKRENTSYKCTLPQFPPNGRWMIINGEGSPGDEVEVNTILQIECKDGYRLNPYTPFIACDYNWESTIFPKCEKKCPAFYSSATTTLRCLDRDGNKIECDQAVDGTYLTFDCIAYYEVPPGSKSSLFCKGGTWDFPKPVCQPVCGKKFNNDTIPLIWKGRQVKELEFPWVIALYQLERGNYKNKCGATLVSRRVVLTAAHCVTNDYGNPLPVDTFLLAAAKYYNAYSDPRDDQYPVQYRKVAKIVVHDGYRGESRRFVYDIAVVVTQQLFKLGPFVQPICINNVNSIYLSNRQIGEVAGWGLTDNNTPADHLRVLKLPYKEGATCSRELPSEWDEKYNFFDKICAGHFQKNMSVCQGDSGSGLIFQNREDNRYYIHGIVSIAPNLHSSYCNYETNALYTSTAIYYGFIDREMTKHYVEDCVLPEHPRNGKWQLQNDAEKNPGDIVPSTTILKFSCNKRYKLTSGSQFYECENTNNAPTCSLRCPQLLFPGSTVITCKNKREQIIDCSEAWEGSSVTFTCPPGFESDRGTQSSTRYCISGSYGRSSPTCVLSNTNKPKTTTLPPIDKDGKKVICTYASWWAYHHVYPEDFDATLCTHIIYQYIGIWDKGDVRVQDDPLDLDTEKRGLYNRIVDLKKKNKNLKVLLSVGGDATSNTTLFTRVSKHAAKTGAFLGSAGYFIKTYHFDGLDIAWNYPAVSDKDNYIRFLETIRQEADVNGWLLSASVRPDLDNTGYNAKEMNRLMDWVTINTYGLFGHWNEYTGNHNNLYASSKDSDWQKQHSNIEAIANNWIKAGLEKEKIVLSVAFYGISFLLKDKNQNGVHVPVLGAGPGVGKGILRYYEICSQYKQGFTEVWDGETKSPYIYNETVWIGYNNKESVWIKGEYIKNNGYAGVNVFPLDGDDNKGVCGEKHILLKHLHGGMGHKVNWEKKNSLGAVAT